MRQVTVTRFTDEATWDGGFYELALELGQRSDERLVAALAAVWSEPDLDGVYLSRDVEPDRQQRHPITSELLDHGHLQGLARLPNGAAVACGTCHVRLDDDPDWLDFYLPMGALAAAYPVGGYPFEPDGESSRQWRDQLDPWLADIGVRVFERVPYRLGLIGFEVSGELRADTVRRTGMPEQHPFGLLWPIADAVTYHPSTE
jgi:hypothetical protein